MATTFSQRIIVSTSCSHSDVKLSCNKKSSLFQINLRQKQHFPLNKKFICFFSKIQNLTRFLGRLLLLPLQLLEPLVVVLPGSVERAAEVAPRTAELSLQESERETIRILIEGFCRIGEKIYGNLCQSPIVCKHLLLHMIQIRNKIKRVGKTAKKKITTPLTCRLGRAATHPARPSRPS